MLINPYKIFRLSKCTKVVIIVLLCIFILNDTLLYSYWILLLNYIQRSWMITSSTNKESVKDNLGSGGNTIQTRSNWNGAKMMDTKVQWNDAMHKLEVLLKNLDSSIKPHLEKAKNSTLMSNLVLQETIDAIMDIKRDAAHEFHSLRIQTILNEPKPPHQLHELSEKLIHLVFKRLWHVQNPRTCEKTKKLICKMDISCGFGCQIHHVTYCLVVAYALNRLLIINDAEWNDAPKGWLQNFQPWSESCQTQFTKNMDRLDSTRVSWDADGSMYKEYLLCKKIDDLKNRPDFLPPAVPRDIGQNISSFHQQPFLWWIGQFVAYLMRPSYKLRHAVETTMAKIGFWGPIVGIHIRTKDKGSRDTLAQYVTSYLKYAEEYFTRLNPNMKARVYIATDDMDVIKTAVNSYPDFDILYIEDHIKSVQRGKNIDGNTLTYLLIDVYLLANTDIIVCRLSSQVCRTAYELMQIYHVDGSKHIISLDQDYHFEGQNPGLYQAIGDYDPRQQEGLTLTQGDQVFIMEPRNSMFYGMNLQTGLMGTFPPYKVRQIVQMADFHDYMNIL